jgi:hypothetical protein
VRIVPSAIVKRVPVKQSAQSALLRTSTVRAVALSTVRAFPTVQPAHTTTVSPPIFALSVMTPISQSAA